MDTKANLLLVEEFSEQEMEAISGGAVTNANNLVGVTVTNVGIPIQVNAAVLSTRAVQGNNAPLSQQNP